MFIPDPAGGISNFHPVTGVGKLYGGLLNQQLIYFHIFLPVMLFFEPQNFTDLAV